ncbi:MAG: SulP family inorganic anion transporter [Planctomycetota bacterium]|nr:SulP family inorganic anion transporter [Planctomycetota bacterium]
MSDVKSLVDPQPRQLQIYPRDLLSGLLVFLVALPLCLGVAQASDAPLFSGILAGIVGGLIVGCLSGSHTSVSGPAAGLTAVVASQIASLGSFEAFLVAVILAGVIQLVLGAIRAGTLAEYFPVSVIKGLLAAIGVILILKQIPHLVGHDSDPEGEMSFTQPDGENTFSELLAMVSDLHATAAIIGLSSLVFLVMWSRIPKLKVSAIPAPMIVVVVGAAVSMILESLGSTWAIQPSHLVEVPIAKTLSDVPSFLTKPDFSALGSSQVYVAAIVIAVVASLETLINLEAVDKLDPEQRVSPKNRELFAQGIGNITSGMIGGLPVTSVIIRSSVNINSGNKTRMSTIAHGVLLVGCVLLIPGLLNAIPLSALAAVLVVTGFKLASPRLFRQMWAGGISQFLPFVITVVAIVLTDLLTGVLIGLGVSLAFILRGTLKAPIGLQFEQRSSSKIHRIQLGSQVSFLNRAVLSRTLNKVPSGGHVLLDARSTHHIDPDIEDMLIDFEATTAPARDIQVSMIGFEQLKALGDRMRFSEHVDRHAQEAITPNKVIELLAEGNRRFLLGQPIARDLNRQRKATAKNQFPLAAILGCVDSHVPSELVFDVGIGDICSVRTAANVAEQTTLASLEYACCVNGAPLIVVLGHTHCGAIAMAVDQAEQRPTNILPGECQHLEAVMQDLRPTLSQMELPAGIAPDSNREQYLNHIAARHVIQSVQKIQQRSEAISRQIEEGRLAIVGAMYDVTSGEVTFLDETTASSGLNIETQS